MKEAGIKRISNVLTDSIGEELGIEKGDQLLTINGYEIKDIVEYRYRISDEELEMEILKADGEIWTLEIEKDYDEELGLEFENPIIDSSKHCQNKCIFCFIDQLPENMRETLYFKDDDSRLSFLQGNYITLTNMTQEELKRIIEFRISPINLSVHTTNPQLRREMLNNKRAGEIYEMMKEFNRHGIQMNCQIVLCPGVNDAEELDRSIKDLAALENVVTTAIVPVGITKYREGLKELKAFDEEMAIAVATQVEKWQKKFMSHDGRRRVHLSDEFYLLAKKDIPQYMDYEGFPQIENGVGLIRKFSWEIDHALKREKEKAYKADEKIRITIATGILARPFMKKIGKDLEEVFPNLDLEILGVENRFFGEKITVSGLVTGGDLIYTLNKDSIFRETNAPVVIPRSMLKAEEEVFLDDHSLDTVEEKTNRRFFAVEVEGEAFVALINELILDKATHLL